MERFADKVRAILLALLVHLAGFGLLFFGLLWTRSAQPVSIPGAVIEAELVGPAAAPKPPPAKKAKPAPRKPEPAPPKPPEPNPEPPKQPQRNDAVEREKVAEIAQEAEKAARAQEERHHQEQIRLEDQQKREAERMKQLQDIRRQREAAEKRRKLEEQKLAQLDDLQKQQARRAAPPDLPAAEQARTGMEGQDNSLAAQYYAAIQNAVTQNWLRPDNAQPGLRCLLRIVQIPGGDVLSVRIVSPCNADALTRASIEQAVKRAAPLPYEGYQKVFSREINFNFQYDG
jgi:colicin import membrane protein